MPTKIRCDSNLASRFILFVLYSFFYVGEYSFIAEGMAMRLSDTMAPVDYVNANPYNICIVV